MYTYIISVALSYKYILYTEITYTNYFASSLNIFINKTLVLSSSVLFAYSFINKKLYYNNNLFSNRSINLTSTGL